MNKYLRKLIIVVIWLAIWQVVAVLVNNSILLASPIETLKALAELGVTGAFYLSIGKTILKIFLGFVLGTALGFLLSVCSYKWTTIKEFLSPFISVVKSIPVVSFIILVLIWFGSSNVSFLVSTIITFPIIYTNVLEGLLGTDVKMLEMAKVFEMGKGKKIRYIYMPSISTHVKAAVSLAIGMAWRGGIAAEVIGQPLMSVGNGLYRAKINLATGEMFAWTIVAVITAFIAEKLIGLLVRRAFK